MKNTFKKAEIITLMVVVGILAMACASLKIANVEWDTLKGPNMARQYIGINTSEVTVSVNYENGERKEVKVKSLNYDKDKAGVQTVAVDLGDSSGSFQTEVMELTGIRLSPAKTLYYIDEKYTSVGLKIFGIWKNMPEQELSFGQTLALFPSGFDSSTVAAARNITYTWNGKTATFPITVIPALTSGQKSAASAFTPAQNQPSPVGTWTMTFRVFVDMYTSTATFNADGTVTFVTRGLSTSSTNYTWFVTGGNMLILVNPVTGEGSTNLYSIADNKLTYLATNGQLLEYTRR
ncbi:MAG: hypothetical protein FWB77_03325 [Treponema sp.]|nr:hypothetical protein [Treponema sp.]